MNRSWVFRGMRVSAWVGAVFAAFVAGRLSGPRTVDPAPPVTPGASTNRVSSLMTGAWGTIRRWESVLEMPPSLLAESSFADEPTRWFVGVSDRAGLDAALAEAGFDDEVRGVLLRNAVPVDGRGFVLSPSDEQVIAIDAGVRERWYRLLSRWGENVPQILPQMFTSDDGLHWLEQTPLEPALTNLIGRLIYPRGGLEYFSDIDVVLRRIPSNRRAREFLRVMSRQRTVMGSLLVSAGEDLDAVSAYWGKGGREEDIRILLESAQRSTGDREIPLIMLLPPFARERLYRYRYPGDPPGANCHFSALNFFEATMDPRLTNMAVCAEILQRDYAPAEDAPRLGDVVLLLAPDGEVVHTCNVVAGELVFSKNGIGEGQPWVITPLSRAIQTYAQERPVTVRHARRLHPAPAEPAPGLE